MRRTWEGNVRELENVILRGILFCSNDVITPDDAGITGDISKECLVELSSQDLPYKEAKEQTLNLFNKNYISNILSANMGNVTQAAKICGLERQALQQIMRRYGIRAEDFRQE